MPNKQLVDSDAKICQDIGRILGYEEFGVMAEMTQKQGDAEVSAVSSGVDFPSIELEILEFWQSSQIFEKSLEQTQGKDEYVFYDGPPFATGLPHHGHLLASVIKDIICRYQTMCGKHVERRFGWDCHGVPIEFEIDKQLGKSTQEAVAELGISGYNQACRGVVQRYVEQWYTTVRRIGRWVDFENDYKTMDLDYMESVWWVFKQLWEKDLIYLGNKVVPYSAQLGTVLSNFEASSNYQMLQDPAITVLVKLTDSDEHLAIWTTTPWTLPSNLGVCVHPEFTYVLVENTTTGDKFYLAKSRYEFYAKRHELSVISEVSGQALVGRKYEPIFPYFANFKEQGAFVVLGDAYVSDADGTGLVHMAPSHGEDDYRIMQAAGIDALACPLDMAGCYTDEVTDFVGQYVKDADKNIIAYIKDAGVLLQHDTLDHSYPCCPRSDKPLLYRTMPSWYVAVEKIKDKIIAANEQIYWVPGHIKHGRFGKWLEGARDWAVSRNRVWGSPVPIWYNATVEAYHCIGSIAELAELTGAKITDLHRDYVDDLTFSLPGQEGEYRRVTEVLDCWFESGSMPYAQQHYPFENKDKFEANFPADFIAEGLDQTRGWFYTLTVLAAALFDRPAFKNIIVQGIVLAEDGKKMSKRLRNYTAPDKLMTKYGADALRLYLINSGLVKAKEQRFADSGLVDMTRRVLLPWYNAYNFWSTYAKIDGWRVSEHRAVSENIMDRWILSRFESLKQDLAEHMGAYRLYAIVPELFEFIEELTNGYIRFNRQRFWGEGLDQDKCAAYTTLFDILQYLNACMAPFAPFLAEYIYRELLVQCPHANLPESVHLCGVPAADASKIDIPLEDAVRRMFGVILLGRQRRNDVKIKVKTPLSRVLIIHKDKSMLDEMAKVSDYIANELNVKLVEFTADETSHISYEAKPNSPVLGKRLGSEFGKYRGLIEAMTTEQILQLESDGSIELGEQEFALDDILIFRKSLAGGDVVTDKLITILLDTNLTDDLVQEGLAREVINRVQKTRKDLGFQVQNRIKLEYQADAAIAAAIEQHLDLISRETLATEVVSADLPADSILCKIDSANLRLRLAVVA